MAMAMEARRCLTRTQSASLLRNISRTIRSTHSQTLWEELLGRKIEQSAAKKLEEAFLEYRVRKSVPSFLPFLPNSSFWIPSSEDTIKDLQVLAERIKVSKPSRQDRSNVYRSSSSPTSNWSSDKGKIGAVSKVAEWSLIQQTERLLSSSMAVSSRDREGGRDSLIKSVGEKGNHHLYQFFLLFDIYTYKEI